jgi:selenocysteine lyase/cysteine desulfurase
MRNLREVLSYFGSHLRVGYVSGLLVIDILLLGVLAVDLVRLNLSGVSWRAAVGLGVRELSAASIEPAVKCLVFLLLILPVGLAAVRISTGGGRHAPKSLGWRGSLVRNGHVGLAIALSAAYPITHAAKLLGGPSFRNEHASYAFRSLYETIWIGPLSWFVAPWPSFLAAVAAVFGRYIIVELRVAPWIREYVARMRIADLGSDVHPINGRHTANFNTAAGAPEIRAVRKHAEKYLATYRSHVPGTLDASNYLLDLSNQCRQLIEELLFGSIPASRKTEFYPGTSRALEVALTRMSAKTVVLSPYEHPTEAAVGRWYSSQTGATLKRLTFSAEDFALDSDGQVGKAAGMIAAVAEAASDPCVLVVSEVCFSTGRVVPVRAILAEVRKAMPQRNVGTIIDAAHAVGNISPLLRPGDYDAYVFSGHKWLFAAEPIGVLISPSREAPYDVWADQVPATWSSARAIASLRASLDMFRMYGVRFFHERSAVLKERFRSKLAGRFDVVGAASKLPESNMLSIRPTMDYRWKAQVPSLREFLRSRNVYPLVLDHEALGTLAADGEAEPPWVRVSFPYFLDVHEIDVLARTLRNMVAAG